MLEGHYTNAILVGLLLIALHGSIIYSVQYKFVDDVLVNFCVPLLS